MSERELWSDVMGARTELGVAAQVYAVTMKPEDRQHLEIEAIKYDSALRAWRKVKYVGPSTYAGPA